MLQELFLVLELLEHNILQILEDMDLIGVI
jgi:hypothetical protein